MTRHAAVIGLVLATVLLSGCAAGRAFKAAEEAAVVGDWDLAVEHYRVALQSDPDNAQYRIQLERAMLNASRQHLTLGREFRLAGELDSALYEYRLVTEYDPTNRQAAFRVSELERAIRERIEASRPQPAIDQMRDRVRQARPTPVLNPASRAPLRIQFSDASLRDILNFIGSATGINVTYDRDFQDRPYSIQLEGVTLEEGLNQILAANGLFYKVLNERTVIVIADTPQKRAQYEEQVIRTFYISHADVQELSQLISSVIRVPQMAVQPMVAVNKTGNAITIRATVSVADIIEKIIASNDKPPAEIIVDVEILEVNRSRAKQYGLNLTQYALGGIFSPEASPTGGDGPSDPDAPVTSGAFNLNTISQGISTADFYGTVPAAVVRFLESDSQTKLIAKPQLRGSEGATLTLNLGDEIPVPSTVFTPIATGGAATNPLTSFSYRPVGVNIEMTPRVTFEGEIILDLTVESSTLGQNIIVAGNALPSFGSRRVVTRLRLREGESNLLAGLLREDERRSLQGFPGLLHLPVVKQLFSGNDNQISQTDIVMLLTPRIIRTHELTEEDLMPIYIGTQQNIGLGGPPPLIAPPDEPGEDTAGGAGVVPGAAAARSPAAAVGTATPQPLIPAPGAPTSTPLPTEPEAFAPPQAHVMATPPGTELPLAGGPYTVPISVSDASQLGTVSVTLRYDPTVLRVRAVQEGSFMRQGGVAVAFDQQVDPVAGRVELSFQRTAAQVGASGAGLLAAVLFDPVGAGTTALDLGGTATTASGGAVPLTFAPVSVTVR